jgi:hypothetical protein
MHRIQAVPKLCRPMLLLVLLTGLGASMMSQEGGIPFLDLTKPAPREQQITGVPGMSVGTIGGQPYPSRYLLPLRVELISISPKPAGLDEKFTVEAEVRNMGTSAYFLPASQNGVDVLQHEGKGRRTLQFNLLLEDPKTGQRASVFAATAFGSGTVADSLLRVDPGKSVRVRFAGDLSSITDGFRHGLPQAQLRVGVSENSFEDQRYFLKSQSKAVVSDNFQTIDIAAR